MYNILVEFGVPMKLVRAIKLCLNETCGKFCIDKHLSALFRIENNLKQGEVSLPLFSILLQNMTLGRHRKTRWD
jgi:hypothetical protein